MRSNKLVMNLRLDALSSLIPKIVQGDCRFAANRILELEQSLKGIYDRTEFSSEGSFVEIFRIAENVLKLKDKGE